MDKIISSIAALGVPGLILVAAIAATGLAGAAGLTAALAMLGPGGMLGGIATLGVAGLISKGLAEYGFDAVFTSVVKKLVENGESIDAIIKKVDKYPISKTLKLKVKDELMKIKDSDQSNNRYRYRSYKGR